jgi:hypothetical protein
MKATQEIIQETTEEITQEITEETMGGLGKAITIEYLPPASPFAI